LHKFLDLGVNSELSTKLQKSGIVNPTPIQQRAIPAILEGRNVVGKAQTGTGKTLAFVLPILKRINPDESNIQALIVTPTRELAIQVTTEVKKLVSDSDQVNVLSVYGGQDVLQQLRKLNGTVHIVVGTPGRLLDYLRRETIDLSNVSMLVLDEADQMLHIGFLADVETIINKTPSSRQTMLFSATIPQEIRSLARRYMNDPIDIAVESKEITAKEIRQLVVETTDRTKQRTLFGLVDQFQPYLAIIFCRTKRRVSKLNEVLKSNGYLSDELHGDLSQAKRELVMTRFRTAKLHLLVATDVAARGLDVEGVTHVFNYDIAQDVESHIHRIGRTGRAGEDGLAVTLVAPKDQVYLELIEKGLDLSIEKLSFTPSEPKQASQPSGQQRKEKKEFQDRRTPRRGNSNTRKK
jgi:ATP-dependent RNA helicase DeaD